MAGSSPEKHQLCPAASCQGKPRPGLGLGFALTHSVTFSGRVALWGQNESPLLSSKTAGLAKEASRGAMPQLSLSLAWQSSQSSWERGSERQGLWAL